VLAAVTATTAEERKTALDHLAEQREILATSIGDNQKLMDGVGAGEELHHEFANLGPAMEDYLATSGAVADAVTHRPATAAGKVAAVDAAMRSSTSDSTSSPPG
jgi:hypothetical protein